MTEENADQLGGLSDDGLVDLECRLVAEAETAAEGLDADALEEIATKVQAVRDERAKRLRAAEEVRTRVDELMKSIRPAATIDSVVADRTPPVPPARPARDVKDDPFEQAARHQLVHRQTWAFRIHLGVYAGVQLLLFTIWLTTSRPGSSLPWFLYPLLGWGVVLVAHYIAMRSWMARGQPPR